MGQAGLRGSLLLILGQPSAIPTSCLFTWPLHWHLNSLELYLLSWPLLPADPLLCMFTPASCSQPCLDDPAPGSTSPSSPVPGSEKPVMG